MDEEIPRALAKYHNKNGIVASVIYSKLDGWADHSIGKLQTLNTDAKVCSDWSDPEAFWHNISMNLRRLIKEQH
jgi:hypothetical protein